MVSHYCWLTTPHPPPSHGDQFQRQILQRRMHHDVAHQSLALQRRRLQRGAWAAAGPWGAMVGMGANKQGKPTGKTRENY